MPTTRQTELETAFEDELDLERISNELRFKMQQLEEFKTTRARYEGAYQQVMDQFANEHNVNTIEEAAELLQRRERLEISLLRRLRAKLNELATIEERIARAAESLEESTRPF